MHLGKHVADLLRLETVPCKMHDACMHTTMEDMCGYSCRLFVLKQRLLTLLYTLLYPYLISFQTHSHLAPKVLGRHVFVKWPSLHEAKVCSSSSSIYTQISMFTAYMQHNVHMMVSL